ncbi:hypothetical protein FO519_006407 [Halicephalobus sp. NKZ332]|nr:hypothetical protein FO519_006407 [Halicephalobus sp. NKZ332]
MTSAAVLKKSDPVAFFDSFLLAESFPDGRSLDQFREIRIYPGTNWKRQRTVIVERGDVVVSVTGRLILQRNNDSETMLFKVEASDKKGQAAVESVKTTLDFLTKKDVFFNRTELQTEEEAFRYQLRFTITIFSAEGFMMDAVLIGLNAVLLQIRIPKVEYKWLQTLERDEQQIDVTRVTVKDNEVRKLNLKETPVFSSFALYIPRGKTEPLLIVDPPTDLIPLCSSTIEMVHISNNKILLSKIQGKLTINPELFGNVAQRSQKHYEEVNESLKKYSSMLKLD